ncbi:hypothetical protein CABS01_03627 [Colletotrichum abscissum]|nr:uncharacterized protein CABS01_03627 [Colletotrichum abscissum]KAK1475350.1 hypothetical protein CABS01_03627 [Colletotrichum abscissum]
MEAVSAAASIAGLLSVAGHVVNGLIKLNGFVQAAKDMDIRTESLNAKVGLLSETLEDIKALLQAYEKNLASIIETSWEPNISTLRSHLVRCGKDLDEWSKSYKSVGKSTSKRRKFLDNIQNKRLRGISDMEIKLTAHRSQLIFDLSVLNAASSMAGLAKIDAVQEGLHQLTELSLQSNATNDESLASAAEESAVQNRKLRDHISTAASDRLRQLENQIEAHRLETRQSLTAISDSIYGLASSISSSIEQLSQPHSQTGTLRRLSYSSQTDGSHDGDLQDFLGTTKTSRPIRTFWSCGSAIGMDDYFVAAHNEDLVHCIFCLQRFDINESQQQAMHVVNVHAPATCNQGKLYISLSDFKFHLCECHSAQRPSLDHNDKSIKLFRVDTSKSRDKRSTDLEGLPQTLDPQPTSMYVEKQICQLLSETEYVEKRSGSCIHAFRDMNQVIERIAHRVFWVQDPPQQLIQVLYKAAVLEEKLNVNFNRPFPRSWAPIPEDMIRGGTRWTGESLCSTPHHNLRWFVKDTAIRQAGWRKLDSEEQQSSCTECRGAATYRTFEEAASHLQRQHFKIPGLPPTKADLRAFCHQYQPNKFNGWLESQWRDDLVPLVASLNHRAPSLQKIYQWKLGILARSDHFITMLWHEAVVGNCKRMLLSSIDGAGKFLTILKDAFPWDGLVHSIPDNSSKMDIDEEDENSSWTRSDGAVDFNLSETVSREEERSYEPPLARFVN